jgi:hypothetical protein
MEKPGGQIRLSSGFSGGLTMRLACCLCLIAALSACALSGAEVAAPPVSKIFDQQLTTLERELVPLAEAMPADKYGFAPTNGEFKGVRTFGQQVSHTAAIIYAVSAAVLVEKNPTEMGKDENGPASLQTKDDIVKYLKESIALGHRAMASLTDKNLTEMAPSAFGSGKAPRISMASIAVWHSFDHYGQMVVYLRMNGIIPPASRR